MHRLIYYDKSQERIEEGFNHSCSQLLALVEKVGELWEVLDVDILAKIQFNYFFSNIWWLEDFLWA